MRHRGDHAEEFGDLILDDVERHAAARQQTDDICLVCIWRRPSRDHDLSRPEA